MMLEVGDIAAFKSGIVAEVIAQLSLNPQLFAVLEHAPWKTSRVPGAGTSAASHPSQNIELNEPLPSWAQQMQERQQDLERELCELKLWLQQSSNGSPPPPPPELAVHELVNRFVSLSNAEVATGDDTVQDESSTDDKETTGKSCPLAESM